MGVHVYRYNWDFFKKNSPELYHFWGFVASDGYISDNEIEIGVNVKDIAILEKFRDLIVPGKPIYKRENTNSYTLKLSCKKYVKKFKDFFNMHSNKKGIEIRFPKIPSQYIKDFIRGYIDGDGCIDLTKGYRGKTVYIGPRLRILGNKEFLTSLNSITKDFVNHKTNSIIKKGKENVYCVTYNFSTARRLLKWLYEDSSICLYRKKECALKVMDVRLKQERI